ncbi:MAG: excinuclease ABC subunit UvrC [Clostridiales bacterium]|nr:excinuclease ABC subunit UvrC [Clostridiales bacterium]
MPEITPLTTEELRKKAMRLPLDPGVYLMKDKRGTVIYVGKAKALKNRVSQYFGSHKNHGVKVIKMVENVADFDYILTDSEFEALVLECSLIKQYSPKYNILLKDSKGYSYIKITKGEWPKISAVYKNDDKNADYIGPFTGSFSVTNSVDEALKIFKLPQCTKVFPRDLKKSRPCLNYFISQCSAPCAGKITAEEYRESVADAVAFLKGDSADAVADMKRRMEEAAENLEFEKAAKLRDRINAVKKINSKQKVSSASVKEQDVFALVSENERSCLNVLRFLNGKLIESEFFIIDPSDDKAEARRELIRSFYTIRDRVPPKISVDGEVNDSELLSDWLSSLAGRKVTIYRPQKGEQLQLSEMCKNNAIEKLMQYSGRPSKQAAALNELASLLGLKAIPDYIEAYDISHTAGSDNVGGMIVFKGGVPFKAGYKRFAVKGFDGQDDYASMAEIAERRFKEYLENKDSGEGFGKLPDLILLDGGAGQVHAFLPVMEKLGVSVPVFGMVKDSHHRTRAIASDGGEIALTSKRKAFTLVSSIQEEVHRFAVSYHHKKHSASSFSSTLTEIEGVGPARAKALLKHFKTISAIKEASVDELKAVKGVSEPSAHAVYKYFHEKM